MTISGTSKWQRRVLLLAPLACAGNWAVGQARSMRDRFEVRAARRNIGALPGEEVLERFRELNFAATYAFMWETPGIYADPMQPFLFLELQGGISPAPGAKPAGASPHEDALLALWDAIASSIRLRPNRPPQTPSATRAEAGTTIPPT